MSLTKMTLEELRNAYNYKGESVVAIAFAAQEVSDDQEFADAAKSLVKAEDEFLNMMTDRNIFL